MSAMFLCFGTGLGECQLCGGWLHSLNPETGEPDVPEGEPGLGGGRYCSLDCLDEAIKYGWYKP